MAPHNLWSQLQKKLQQQLAPEDYETWFRPLRARSDGDRRLVLVVPNERFLSTLEESYRPDLDRAIAGLNQAGLEVFFVLDDEKTTASTTISLEMAPTSAVPLASSLAFNPKYLFENFVVGNSNQFAHAAARAVADRPSSSYNPLFLYGGVGLGKTHLLHAVGHQILAQHPHLRVLYLPAEQFVNELINSIRFDRMPAFRERYRTIDALLIDDVQFIANKERTQEEFFHTFNTLYTSQKQIILSSDASPKDIPTLEERLRSRFQWGLIADIQPPDLETKVAILRKKADFENTNLPNEVAEFVAQQVKSNIRELEGMLNRVIAFSSLTGKPLSLELARETLRDILPHEGRKPTAAEITKSVARHYGLKVVEIKSKNNSKQISFPRQVAMYLCKRLTDLSFPEIGKQFNDKHHSTVMYSVDKIQQLRQDDGDFDRVLQNLERGLS